MQARQSHVALRTQAVVMRSRDKPPCLPLSPRRCLCVLLRVVRRSVIVSTMSRKNLTDEELIAMVHEHHDSDDNVDSLYGFSSSDSSESSNTSCKPHYITPDLFASKYVSPDTLPQPWKNHSCYGMLFYLLLCDTAVWDI